jgi:hypothetical protein
LASGKMDSLEVFRKWPLRLNKYKECVSISIHTDIFSILLGLHYFDLFL